MRVLENNQLGFVAGGLAEIGYSGGGSSGDGGGGSSVANGCTGVPDSPFGYRFREACDGHDIDYSQDTKLTRAQADENFLNNMLNICETKYNNETLCRATAYVYCTGVRIFGGIFYDGNN